VPYLVEHEDSPEGREHAKRVHRALEAHRESLPASVRHKQTGYAWVDGANPEDDQFAIEQGRAPGEFISLASSDTHGGTYLFNRETYGANGLNGTLNHEFAHTLDDSELLSGRSSKSARWQEAAINDAKVRSGFRGFTPSGRQSPVRTKRKARGSGSTFPEGVTDYGTANADEDYAESFRLYRTGPIGTVPTRDGGTEPVYFRDLFPERAAILDEIMPDFAREQKAEIAEMRRTGELPFMSQGEERLARAIRDVAERRSSGTPRMRPMGISREEIEKNGAPKLLSPQEWAEIDARLLAQGGDRARVHDGVLTGKVGIADDVNRVLTEDTGREGVPVRDLTLDDIRGYKIDRGHAWRFNGVTYLLEDGDYTPEQRSDILNTLYTEHQSLPKEAQKFQRGFILLQGKMPVDEYEEAKERLEAAREGRKPVPPQWSTLASAVGGDIFVYRLGELSKGQNPAGRIRDSVKHEAGHNIDAELNPHAGPISATPRWREASSMKPARKIKGFVPNGRGTISPIMYENNPQAPYPGGVTRYGQTSAAEDFAEAISMYFAGVLGEANGEPVYFRDLFPDRAALLDFLFPIFAKDQLAEIPQGRDLRFG
jgi:hypothetical protein